MHAYDKLQHKLEQFYESINTLNLMQCQTLRDEVVHLLKQSLDMRVRLEYDKNVLKDELDYTKAKSFLDYKDGTEKLTDSYIRAKVEVELKELKEKYNISEMRYKKSKKLEENAVHLLNSLSTRINILMRNNFIPKQKTTYSL